MGWREKLPRTTEPSLVADEDTEPLALSAGGRALAHAWRELTDMQRRARAAGHRVTFKSLSEGVIELRKGDVALLVKQTSATSLATELSGAPSGDRLAWQERDGEARLDQVLDDAISAFIDAMGPVDDD